MNDALLKEVYEKGRKKKMAIDGPDGEIPESVAGAKKVPPFMKGRNKPNVRADAKKEAAKRRLGMMKKGVGNFGGPGDGVHTKKTGK